MWKDLLWHNLCIASGTIRRPRARRWIPHAILTLHVIYWWLIHIILLFEVFSLHTWKVRSWSDEVYSFFFSWGAMISWISAIKGGSSKLIWLCDNHRTTVSPVIQIRPDLHACVCWLSRFCSVQLCDPMVCSPPGSSVHGILQARILEWVAMPSSRGSSLSRDRTDISYISCSARRTPYH